MSGCTFYDPDLNLQIPNINPPWEEEGFSKTLDVETMKVHDDTDWYEDTKNFG